MMGLYPPSTGPNLRVIQLEDTAVPPIDVYNETEVIAELGMSALPNNTQVIAVHTDSISREILLVSQDACDRYEYLSDKRNNASDVLKLINANLNLIQVVADYFTIDLEDAFDIYGGVIDSLRVNAFYGYAVPAVFTPAYLADANTFVNQLNYLQSYYPDELARYAGSEFLTNLAFLFNNAVEQKSDIRFQLYSAHDTSIWNVFASLKIPHLDQPPYASTLLFQLIQDNNIPTKYYVTTAFNDVLLIIPTCKVTMCPLDTFLDYIESRAFTNITKACEMGSHSGGGGGGSSTDDDLKWYWWVVIGGGAGLILIAAVVVAVIVYKKKNANNKTSEYEKLNFIKQ